MNFIWMKQFSEFTICYLKLSDASEGDTASVLMEQEEQDPASKVKGDSKIFLVRHEPRHYLKHDLFRLFKDDLISEPF